MNNIKTNIRKMEMQNLMRPELKDEWGIKKLQNCLLNIMKYIHDFCIENNIEYCIMGGSALGAVRHGGFIPWDDDIDIFMTPDSYQRFRQLFQKKGDKDNFYLQELGESNGLVEYAKLRLNNSEFIEEMVDDWDIHHGVFVDIMIMQNYPNDFFSRKWQLFWEMYIQLKSCANRNYSKRGKMVQLLLKIMQCTSKRFLIDYAIKQVWRYNDKLCDNYFHLYISQPLYKSIYPKNLFISYKLTRFETIELMVPVGVEEYLTILFGDYKKIPDLESIRFHQHVSKWSAETSFIKRKPGNGYSDEKYYW